MLRFTVYLFFLILCGHPLSANPSSNVVQDFILDSNPNHNRIEFFYVKPEGTGPFPVMFMLHGYQAPEQNLGGGKQLIDLQYADNFVGQGIVAVSISVPGFGLSEGAQDLAGPDSQRAIKAVIDYFKTLDFIDGSRMGIYGISKGAMLASMVSAQCPELMCQILEAGRYDLLNVAPMPEYLKGIHDEILRIGCTREALIERSAVYHVDNVKAATLILHGALDDRKTLASAQLLHEKLIAQGLDSRLEIYPKGLHVLPRKKWDVIASFVREHFFDLYSIGVKLSMPAPGVQIAKIFPKSPAARSRKLKVGDTILSISPNNDENEMNALGMPLNRIVPLILGKKGTTLRLHVQHTDLSLEDIAINRGE